MSERAPTGSTEARPASAMASLGGETPSMAAVRRLIAPIVEQMALDLYDLEHRGGIVRVTIDTPAGSPSGVDLEAIALATRLISRELDHSDPLPGRYTLEVTSPGVERSLRTPAHFMREVGKTVALRLSDVTVEHRRLTGVLIAADDDAATIRVGGADGDADAPEQRIEYHRIDRARTVFEWGPGPKPGRGPSKSKGSSGASRDRTSTGQRPRAASKLENQEES
jgi:ribosome maturation factor RimP